MYLFYQMSDAFWLIFSAFGDQYIMKNSTLYSHFFQCYKSYITRILHYEVCFFLFILFVKNRICKHSIGEVQNFYQFATFNEEANTSTSYSGIVIYLILLKPSHNYNVSRYLLKKF